MPPALPRTRGRLKNQFIVTFLCIFIFLITYVGYSFFQNSTGAVNPDIARFAIFSYYNLEIYVKNIISWNVPTMDSKTKWKLSKKTPQFDWSNHTGCIALPDSYLLMAMRTPKAASTTLEELISKLSEDNHFVVNKVALLSLNPPGPEESAQMDRVRSYCSYFSSLRKRTVSVAHIRYLDFGANHYPQPFYVGTIRNPVTRMQSHYNYDHFADRPWHISHQERGADTPLRPPTFVECVRAYMNRNNATGEAAGRTKGVGGSGGAMGGMYSCMNQVYLNVQLRYYCGMDPICKRGSLDMILDKALTNLNRQFRVVVVVEEMARSVALLDKLIPSFFGGAKAVYESSSEGGLHSNTNTKIDSKQKTPSSSLSSSVAVSVPSAESADPPLIEGLPADVYQFLAKILSHEMLLYEAALRHSKHNAQQCGLLPS